MRLNIVESSGNGSVMTPTGRSGRFWVGVTLLLAMLVAVPVAVGHRADAGARLAAATACTGSTYTVVAGDSWSRIASVLGVSMNSLLAANGATTSTVIHPGQVLCVPGGATVTTAPTTTSATVTTAAGGSTAAITQFPAQGLCWFTDTFGAPRSGGRAHEGVDIIAGAGHLVYAAVDGTLTKQYIDAPGSLSGNGWRLTRSDGTYYFYAHLSSFAPGLKVGSVVASGQIIGYVGMTGNAGTAHLHFEVHPGGGAAVNPTPVVRAVDGCGTSVVPAQPGSTPTTTTPTTTTTTTTPTPTTTTPTTTTSTIAPTTTVTVPPSGTTWKFVEPVNALVTGDRPLPAGRASSVRVGGLAGVPSTTTGVMVRVSTRDVTSSGFLTVHSCAAGSGGTATLTVAPGRLNAITSVTAVSDGNICITPSERMYVRVDVIGYLAPDGVGLQPVVARRALDTRSGMAITPARSRQVTPRLLGTSGTAKAVTVTLTLLDPVAAGSIGIGACGGKPWVLSYTAAAIQTLSAVVPTSDTGVCLSSTSQVDATLDVTGLWNGTGAIGPSVPQRLFDSRSSHPITSGGAVVTVALPAGASRAQITITAIAGAQSGALYAWNCTQSMPVAAVVATSAHSATSVTVSMSTVGGSVCLSSNTSLDVVLDVTASG